MDYDPDAPYNDDYGDHHCESENDIGNGVDRIITEDELFNSDDLHESDVFPGADELGLAGSFAHMMQDESREPDEDVYELGPDIDEQNMNLAMSMCTASGDAREDGPDDKPFESFVRTCINTPGFFKRRTK